MHPIACPPVRSLSSLDSSVQDTARSLSQSIVLMTQDRFSIGQSIVSLTRIVRSSCVAANSMQLAFGPAQSEFLRRSLQKNGMRSDIDYSYCLTHTYSTLLTQRQELPIGSGPGTLCVCLSRNLAMMSSNFFSQAGIQVHGDQEHWNRTSRHPSIEHYKVAPGNLSKSACLHPRQSQRQKEHHPETVTDDKEC